MRVASWIFGGMLIGVAVGVAAGLVRRRPTRFQRPSYAGGYDPPRPSSDHTAVPPPLTAGAPRTGTGTGVDFGRGTERAPVG